MKRIFLLLVFIIFITGVNAQTVINDKNVEVVNVPAFSSIKISGGFDIYISQSTETAVAISASEEKYKQNIRTIVVDGVLTISHEGGFLGMNENRNLRAYISLPDLKSIEASGASDVMISGHLKLDQLKLKLSGASDFKGLIDIRDLSISMSGASTMNAEGTAKNLNLQASGASDLKNYDLAVDQCIATISGASDIRITINQSVSVKASGASSLYFKGNPGERNINTSGASSVVAKN